MKKKYCILLAVVLNFTNFLFFCQENPLILAIPTPFLHKNRVYIDVFVNRLRYKRLRFFARLRFIYKHNTIVSG